MSSQKCVVTCIKASSTARLRLEILSDGVSEHQILKTFLVCVCVCGGGGGGMGCQMGQKAMHNLAIIFLITLSCYL